MINIMNQINVHILVNVVKIYHCNWNNSFNWMDSTLKTAWYHKKYVYYESNITMVLLNILSKYETRLSHHCKILRNWLERMSELRNIQFKNSLCCEVLQDTFYYNIFDGQCPRILQDPIFSKTPTFHSVSP